MTPAMICVCLWVLLAFVMQSIPSTDNHWRRAYVLIALGIPLLGWVTYQNGPFMALLALGIGGVILRWPVIYLMRWLRRKLLR